MQQKEKVISVSDPLPVNRRILWAKVGLEKAPRWPAMAGLLSVKMGCVSIVHPRLSLIALTRLRAPKLISRAALNPKVSGRAMRI